MSNGTVEPFPENDLRQTPAYSRRAVGELGISSFLAVLGLAPPALGQHAVDMLGSPGMQRVDATAPGFLSVNEAAFIRAAVSRLIPSDGAGPGAIETDVYNFIDKQLAGPFGSGERLFMGGPFNPAAIPQAGYQLQYSPAEMFRKAIAAIHAHLAAAGKTFDSLTNADQDAFLADQLEAGKLGDLNGVPAGVFFESLLELTQQGYFADPVYGGNKDMLAWKAIGLPGAYDAYRDTIGRHGEAFAIGPFSLADHDTIPERDMKDMEAQR